MLQRARQVLIDVRAATRRHGIAQNLYIASLCLAYLLPNIWAARTLLYYVAIPLALIGADLALLRSIARSPVFILSGVFLALLALTSLAAPDASMKVIGNHLLQTARILLFLLITAELVRRDDTFLKTLMVFVAAAAAVAAVISIIAFYGGMKPFVLWNFTTRMQGTPGVSMSYNSNVVGAIYAIACVGGAALLATRRLSRLETGILLVSLLVLLATVVLTQSRGSILAMIVGLTVIAFLAGSRRQRLSFVLGAIVVVACFSMATPMLETMVQRGVSMRPTLWLHHLQLAGQSPWLGHGLSFDPSLKHAATGSIMSNAHNIFLSALVRGGVVAAATLLGLVAVCLHQSWGAWRRGRVLVPFALMVTATVAASFDYEIMATSLGWEWLLFWLPVGLCLAAGSQASAGARWTGHARASP